MFRFLSEMLLPKEVIESVVQVKTRNLESRIAILLDRIRSAEMKIESQADAIVALTNVSKGRGQPNKDRNRNGKLPEKKAQTSSLSGRRPIVGSTSSRSSGRFVTEGSASTGIAAPVHAPVVEERSYGSHHSHNDTSHHHSHSHHSHDTGGYDSGCSDSSSSSFSCD
ncbi:hypothetical protein MCU23_18225 [Klebsiella quasipneumoniae]|uniref:hypothetical protein n=1 Tax=Klebsiella quasipneumoniae TaxID=1463165 RepID=UPI00224609FA|nr:hypothetical protein [Klebsiella quasipneumoniae]MCX2317288.1 hypothetical protein [Klebsiella quasipneumoniae]